MKIVQVIICRLWPENDHLGTPAGSVLGAALASGNLRWVRSEVVSLRS